jgi:hypothetical protein
VATLFLAWNMFTTIAEPIKQMCVLSSHRNTARITVAPFPLALLPRCLVQFTAPVAKEDLDDIELLSADAAGGSQFLHSSPPFVGSTW